MDMDENTESNTFLNFNEALSVIDTISSESFVTEAWVPSLNRSVKIKEINAKQQKTMIESAIDSSVAKSTFLKTFHDIVSSNCLEEKSVIDSFTIVDKNSIAFSMRSQISDTLKVIFQEEPLVENVIELKDILNKFSEYKHPNNETINFSKNSINIDVEISLPTFSEEVKFNSHVYGKKVKDDQVEEIKSIITNAFLGETAKYINEITIDGKELKYKKLSIIQKLQFVEKLPAALVQKVLENIVKWKTEIDKISTVSFENLTKVIEVDNLLFLTN